MKWNKLRAIAAPAGMVIKITYHPRFTTAISVRGRQIKQATIIDDLKKNVIENVSKDNKFEH